VTTVYTVTGEDANQCKASRSHTVMVNPCLGLIGHNGLPVKLYPNPSKGIVSLECDVSGILRVYNTWGACVSELNIVSGSQTVDLQGLRPGLYFFIFDGLSAGTSLKVILTD
jgi:hypothetical protein